MSLQSPLRSGALALSAVACLTTSAFAGGGEPGVLDARAAVGAARVEAANTPRKLLNTYSATANGSGSALAAFTYNVVDASTVRCNNAAGCHIGMEAMVQISPNGGDWAICFYVDGVSVSCPYQGGNGVGSFVAGNYRGFSALVAQGPHDVEVRVYPNNAASLYRWSVDYRIYKG